MAMTTRGLETIQQRPGAVAAPAPRGYRIIARARSIPTFVRLSMLLFVFTFPFGTVGLSGYASIAKLGGMFFFGLYAFYFAYDILTEKRSFPMPAHAVRWLLVYLIIYVLHGFFDAEAEKDQLRGFLVGVFTLGQLIVFLWLTSDLFRDQKLMRHVMMTYAAAGVLLALAMLAGVPGFSEADQGRMSAMGANPNELGQHFALATIIFIGLAIGPVISRPRDRILIGVLALIQMAALVNTGSRAAILGFFIGCSVLMFRYLQLKTILIVLTLGLLCVGAAGYIVLNDPETMKRFEEAYYEGNYARREQIYPAAIEMILEKPVFGWHPVGFLEELGTRLGEKKGRDVHNFLLELLITGGIAGTVPFLMSLWLCFRAAWKKRKQWEGLMPLALMTTVMSFGLTHGTLVWKPQWLVMAFAVAAAWPGAVRLEKKTVIAARRPGSQK